MSSTLWFILGVRRLSHSRCAFYEPSLTKLQAHCIWRLPDGFTAEGLADPLPRRGCLHRRIRSSSRLHAPLVHGNGVLPDRPREVHRQAAHPPRRLHRDRHQVQHCEVLQAAERLEVLRLRQHRPVLRRGGISMFPPISSRISRPLTLPSHNRTSSSNRTNQFPPSQVASNFLTQIIARFGYSTVKTNLFTVAPFACGTLAMLITAWSSDRLRERGLHLASSLALVVVGCILLACLPISSTGPAYFATFLVTMGAYTPSCLFHTWHQCNDPSEDGRAFRVGSLTFLANLGGVVSANVSLDFAAASFLSACFKRWLFVLLAFMTLARDNRTAS